MTLGASRRLPNAALLAREALSGNAETVELYAFLASRLLSENPELSRMQALDMAEDRIDALADAVDRVMCVHKTKGLTCAYRWQGDKHSAILIHASIETSCDSDPMQSDAAIISRRSAIHSALLEPSFGDARFERVCRSLLHLYGADSSNTGVTRPTGDGGLDFFGVYSPGAEAGSRRLATQPYRVAGQAKRWSRSVGKEEVELFVSRLQHWRLGGGEKWSSLPLWFRESRLPILGLFITTSTFQAPVEKVASQGVCICLDGEVVAQDLAVSSAASSWFSSPDWLLDIEAFKRHFDD